MYPTGSGKSQHIKRFRCRGIQSGYPLPQCPGWYTGHIKHTEHTGHSKHIKKYIDQYHLNYKEPGEPLRIPAGVPQPPYLRREPGADFVSHCDYPLKDK